MSTSSSPRKAAAIGVLGAALALIPSTASADPQPGAQVPSISPVAQTIDSIQRIPVVSQAYLLFGNLASAGGGTVWGTLDLLYTLQIPQSTTSTPIQLSSNYNELLSESTSASSGADQGAGRLEVVGPRVARDGRSVRVKVACVGGSAGCDGIVRIARHRHHHRVVLTKRVRLASGTTAKYTLRV